MNQVIVIFEFKNENLQKQTALKDLIRKYVKFAFITNNACIIWTEEAPAIVRDKLKVMIGIGDRLFVGMTSAPAAWLTTIEQQVTDYLQKNLK